MVIRKTTELDIDKVNSIFEEARGTIASLGINQWQDGYPSREVIISDMADDQSYVVDNNGVCATFAMLLSEEPTYNVIYNGHWLTGDDTKDYIAIHRVAILLSMRGQGIAGRIISYAENFAKDHERKSLRIDTPQGNVVMRRMLEKNGFVYCGIIHLQNGDERVAYEKVI